MSLSGSELDLQQTLERQWQHSVQKYEDESNKKKARETVPLVQLTTNAQRKFLNRNEKDKRGSIKEFLFLELLRWFKLEFFQWVDTLACDGCGGKTQNRGMLGPNNEELRYGAGRVENHLCSKCGFTNRFPRYNCPVRLLTSRRGRCGEWANCFVLLSRALNFETRYVLDETDHVWAEVFSESLGNRWTHADPCENAFDKPLLYEKGWKKKLTYVFSISALQVLDVTWRYSQDHAQLRNRRTKYREAMVVRITENVNDKIRAHNYGLDWSKITLRLITEYVEFLNNDAKLNARLKEEKWDSSGLQGRTTGSVQWRKERGELGDCSTSGSRIESNSNVFQIEPPPHATRGVANLTYNPGEDLYSFNSCVDEGVTSSSLYGWENGVYQSQNIFRKEEFDWKMVYLCRNPECRVGEKGVISWKFSLPTTSAFKFDQALIKCHSKLYENANVSLRVSSVRKADKKESLIEELDSDAEQVSHTIDLSSVADCSVILTATLSGGRGDVHWQHAQLFREAISQPSQNPLHIKLHYSHS